MKLLCIDGNSVLNRAYYGIKLLTTKDGRHTNAIYGFMSILAKLLDSVSPDAVAVAFDLRGKTFRHKMYAEYKATRKGMDEELAEQLPVVQRLLTLLGYRVVTSEGYEADDILGTLANACVKRGDECVIATGDRDSLQLVGGGVSVILTTTHFGRGEDEIVDTKAVLDRYGVSPRQLIEVKALMGDSSDNIPGVSGVGEKTALSLIARYGSLDGVYAAIDDPEIKAGVRAKLIADRESAYLSRELVTIAFDAPVPTDCESYKKQAGDGNAASALLTELEMYTTIERFRLKADKPREQTAMEALFAVPFKPAMLEGLERIYICADPSGGFAFDGERVYSLIDRDICAVMGADIEKYAYDSKRLYRTALEGGVCPRGVVFDIRLAAYLLNPLGGDYSLERLCAEYRARGGYSCDDYPEATKLVSLCETLSARLCELDMKKLHDEIELPLALVLAKMEREGFLLDVAGIRLFGEELAAVIDRELAEIYALAGREFNLNSPKQLGDVLFNTLKLPAAKKTKSGYSTDAETLEKLRGSHKIIDHILLYRTYFKLNSTYVAGLLSQTDRSDRVHTEFNQTETRTGRISSTNPNLQNIPVRTELGSRLRKYFVAESGRVLLDADYSQIELRVLAHLSGDERMKRAFLDGADIHTETAASIFSVPRGEVTPELRRRAKAVNFGIVYGIGAFSLANDTGVSQQEAASYIEGYLATYSGVRDYLERTVEDARKNGYVTTMYNRRRSLPELSSSNRNIAALGRRLAMNTPIQGSAADIIKIAMIKVQDRLECEGLDARLILQVHDELIVSASLADAEKAKRLLVEEMEAACALVPPLVADIGTGSSWYDAK